MTDLTPIIQLIAGVFDEAIGAFVGTLAGGGLVWLLERQNLKKREARENELAALRREEDAKLEDLRRNEEKKRQHHLRLQDIRQQKASVLLGYLPQIRVNLYSGEKEGRFFRDYFFDCYNIYNASKIILERPTAKDEMAEIETFFHENVDTMKRIPSYTDTEELEKRRDTAEAFSQKIFLLFNSEVSFLMKKLTSNDN